MDRQVGRNGSNSTKGEMQKVLLLRNLMNHPDYLLLDEQLMRLTTALKERSLSTLLANPSSQFFACGTEPDMTLSSWNNSYHDGRDQHCHNCRCQLGSSHEKHHTCWFGFHIHLNFITHERWSQIWRRRNLVTTITRLGFVARVALRTSLTNRKQRRRKRRF